MNSLDTPLANLMPSISAWAMTSKGVTAIVRNKGLTTFYIVTDTELSSLTPQAPFIIRAMLQSPAILDKDQYEMKTLHPLYFVNALELASKGNRVWGTDGREVYMLGIGRVDTNPFVMKETVTLSGAGYPVGHLHVPELGPLCDIIYPNDHVKSVLNVYAKDLDRDYPGWRERYNNALLLGYEGNEAAEFLFDKTNAVNPVELNSVSFD